MQHPVNLTVGYVAATMLLGGLLAYPVHLLVTIFAAEFEYADSVSRSVILAALLLLIPFLRGLDLGAAELGYHRRWRRSLLAGWGVGVALMLPPLAFFFFVGFRVIDPRVEFTSAGFIGFCVLAVASGLVIGLIEETVFRGMLLQSFSRRFGFWLAASITSVLYACLHFVEPGVVPGSMSWSSGFAAIADSLLPLARPLEYWDSFASLFLLGLGFCWVRRRTGSLWWCIGLHAASVTCIRILKESTVRDEVNPYKHLVGTYDHFVGELTTIWLLVIALLVYALGRVSPRIDTRSP